MFVRYLAAVLLAGLAAAPAATAESVTPFRPVAVVNDSAITGYDLAQRAQLMVMLGFPASDSEALRAAALDQLVQDRLKLQAGRELGIVPTEETYADGLALFAEQTGMTVENFVAQLSRAGITERALRDMLEAELVWRDVIRARFISRLDVAESEIDAELALTGETGATSYRIREIGLPLNGDGRTEAETRALADRLARDLAAGGDFAAAARRYSRAPSAGDGGDVGWIGRNQLPPEIYEAIATLSPGQVSAPLPVPGGVTIVKIDDIRTDAADAGLDAPGLRDEIRNRIANQRAARLAEGYLQELRRDALIEVR